MARLIAPCKFLLHLFTLCLFLSAASAVATTPSGLEPRATKDLPITVIHQFPAGTWAENLAYRETKNTFLITTVAPLPRLYEVRLGTNAAPRLIHQFAGVTSLTGIAELKHDIFYVAGGNLTEKLASVPGSWAVWRIDLQHPGKQKVQKLASFPQAAFLNGMTVLNDDTILLADSTLGAVWSCNVRTAVVTKVIQDVSMLSPPRGINGIKLKGKELFYTNSGNESFWKISIDLADGAATGTAMLLASGIAGDDFTFDRTGNAYVAADGANELVTLPQVLQARGGVSGQVIAGAVNSTVLAGPSAAQFGRNNKRLYLTTNGGVEQYLTQNYTIGGSLSMVQLS